MRNLQKKKEKGFTLIELLVVISIIVLILGVAAPKLGRSTLSIKLKTSAESMCNLLETAKSFASVQNCKAQVLYNSASKRMRLFRTDIDDADGDGDSNELVDFDQGFELAEGITVSFSGASGSDEVTFTSWGGIEGESAVIKFSSKVLGKSKTLTVNKDTGYIKIN